MIEEGLSSDVLLITGGVSVGEYDLVGEASRRGGHAPAVPQGRGQTGQADARGRCGDCLVIGLPGNPVSTYTGFAIFVAPALRRMMGYTEWRNLELPATLERPLRAGPKRQTYHLARVVLVGGRPGRPPGPQHGLGGRPLPRRCQRLRRHERRL